MFFRPPNLSDETATELMEFFQEFSIALEGHYLRQLMRYARKKHQKADDFLKNLPTDQDPF